MVGLPTRLKVADLVFPTLGIDASLRPWFMLGALGPAIGDFVPNEVNPVHGAPGRTGYYSAWQQAFQIAIGNDQLNPPLPGVVTTLRTLQQLLTKLGQLVANRDFNGMEALNSSGALNDFKSASADLVTILQNFSNPGTLGTIGNIIGTACKPKIDNTSVLLPTSLWTGREWLHWKRTGDFAAQLVADAEAADAADKPRFAAYAAGWCVAYTTLVSGSGFVNSVTGSCYRTYWWRSRWAANFIDTWVWGFYGSGASVNADGVLSSAYETWPSLCDAGLHTWIDPQDLGGVSLDPESTAQLVVEDNQPLPQALDPEFVTFWLKAWTTTYNPAGDPLFTAERLNAGYLMTWLVLWFQTSGDVIGCNPQPPATPPSACTAADNAAAQQWSNPTQTNPNTGQPYQPVVTTPEHDPNVGETVCGVILALLGAGAVFCGAFGVGAGLIVGGVDLAVNGEEQLNWDALECNIYWLNWYLWNGLDALHKLTVLGGFQYPYAADLAISSPTTLAFGSSQLSYMSSATMCKSRALKSMLVPWDGSLLPPANWTNYPTGAAETSIPAPATSVWDLSGLWPSAFIDDHEGRNPALASITTSPASYYSGVTGSFGPAVANVSSVIAVAAHGLPNWNLDGDRALGWLTWQLTQPYAVPLQTAPES